MLSLMQCGICLCSISVFEDPVDMSCGHEFCRSCWEGWGSGGLTGLLHLLHISFTFFPSPIRFLNVKIQEGDAHNIFCPAYECYQLVPVHVIESVVSREMDQRYLQFDIKVETNNYDILCLCTIMDLPPLLSPPFLCCRRSWRTTRPSAGVLWLGASGRSASLDQVLVTVTLTASPCCPPQLSTAAKVTSSAGKLQCNKSMKVRTYKSCAYAMYLIKAERTCLLLTCNAVMFALAFWPHFSSPLTSIPEPFVVMFYCSTVYFVCLFFITSSHTVSAGSVLARPTNHVIVRLGGTGSRKSQRWSLRSVSVTSFPTSSLCSVTTISL